MSLIFGFAGPSITASLGLSLSIMATVSLGLFWSKFRRAGVSTTVKKARTFKNESKTVPIQIGTGGSRWVRLTSASLEGRPGLSCEVNRLQTGAPELLLTPSLAGRIDSLTVRLKATDPLGLFTKERTVSLDFVLESLPLALRRAPLRLHASPLSFGENPAGRSGAGQELYAVSEYEIGLDPRDIMWRRVAGMPDESIPVRIREANVRKVVSIGVRVSSRTDDERARRGDLVAEAIAQMGVQLLLIGSVLEITRPAPLGTRMTTVSNLGELADATELVWDLGREGLMTPTSPSAAGSFDLFIVGPSETGGAALAALSRSRQLLVVSELDRPPHLPQSASLFTGRQDLSAMTSLVLAA